MKSTGTAQSPIEQQLSRALHEIAMPGVVSAYLFGSHAQRRAHAESDIDLGVLLNYDRYSTSRERFEARLRLPSLLSGKVPASRLDVVILNDAPPLLARRIVTEGRRVFLSDAALDHDFVRDVQLRAADLAPFLRRAQRVKLAALAR